MSKLLIQESPLTFQPSLAVAIGLNEAIVLQQIHYWISNARNKGYEQDGYKWVYNTYVDWKTENFPFWSENTIQRIFTSLEDKGLVISIQPMKGKYDRTKYYRIDYPKLEVFDGPKLVCSLNESENTTENTTTVDDFQNQPIPDNYPLDWYLSHNVPVPEGWKDPSGDAQRNDFEKSLGFGSLPWDTGDWVKFSKWVVKTFDADPLSFQRYSEWRKGDGKYNAMNNKQIRLNPMMFVDTGYPSFLAHAKMNSSINDGRNSLPQFQKVTAPTEEVAVPNPFKRRK